MPSSTTDEELPPPLHYDVTLDDYYALSRHLETSRPRQNLSTPLIAFLTAGPAVIVEVAFPGQGLSFVVGACTGTAALYFAGHRARARVLQSFAPRSDGIAIGPRVLSLNERGVTVTMPNGMSEILWPGILALEHAPDYFFIRIDTMSAHVIPKRAFAAPTDADSFASHVERRLIAQKTP